MSFQIEVQAGRTGRFTFDVYEGDGSTPVVLVSGDVARFKISLAREGTPVLDLDSVAASENGSTVSKTLGDAEAGTPAVVTVMLHQDDTAELQPGVVYYGELTVVDSADSDLIKHVDLGDVTVSGCPGGDVGTS